MKKLLKVSSYILATVLAFVLSNVTAFAADNNSNGSLSGGQVIGGLAVLLLVILIPIMKSARKAHTN
jgi:hypothetical protein